MLPLERRVVAELTTSGDADLRHQVECWVDGTLSEMSDVLRLGVILESAALSVWVWARRPANLNAVLGWLERSPISVLRSYPRLFRSLVLFGELELGGTTST